MRCGDPRPPLQITIIIWRAKRRTSWRGGFAAVVVVLLIATIMILLATMLLLLILLLLLVLGASATKSARAFPVPLILLTAITNAHPQSKIPLTHSHLQITNPQPTPSTTTRFVNLLLPIPTLWSCLFVNRCHVVVTREVGVCARAGWRRPAYERWWFKQLRWVTDCTYPSPPISSTLLLICNYWCILR